MRAYFKSYWFWFYVAFSLVSILDFIDHITRDDKFFLNIYGQWFLFTACCHVAVCISIYYLNIMLRKIFRMENLITQSVAIILGMIVHIFITGPAFDRLINGQGTLNFKFNVPIILIVLGIFYTARMLTYAVLRMSAKKMR